MERAAGLARRLYSRLRERQMFWRILALYTLGSALLLGVFSLVLTNYLTSHATEEAIERDHDALGQAYAMADYVLNTTYETYYKMYQSYEAAEVLFAADADSETALLADKLFRQINPDVDCVASVYLVNRASDRVYASDGRISGLDDFYDQQALRLFQFYNESSSTLFLPRSTRFAGTDGQEADRRYITLIFSRRSAVMVPMGGLIVNLDEERLIDLITGDLRTPEDLYIISENGSILANADAAKVNTSLYGSALWDEVQAHTGTEDVSFRVEYGGQECLVTVRNAPRLRFCFLRITPVSQLNSGVAYIRTFALVCLGCFLALAFALAVFASRFIYRPIGALVTNLRRHPMQDSAAAESTPAPLDEIAFLGHTYQSLAQEVESLVQDNRYLARARRRELLTNLLYGLYPTEEKCRREAEPFGLPPGGHWLAAVLTMDDFSAFTQAHDTQDLALYRYGVANIAEELLAPLGTAYCAELVSDQVAVLLCLPAPPEAEACRTAFTAVVQAVQTHLHGSISCGVGTAVTSLSELVTSYNRAMAAFDYRLVRGRGAVILYEEIAGRQGIIPEYPLETDAAIVQALRTRNADKANAELDSFFAGYALANVDAINMATTQLAISLSRTVHSMAAGHEGTRALPNYRVLSGALHSCTTLDERRDYLKDYCRRVIEIRSSELQTKRETLIERIEEFIKTNYANPMLNTEDIAAFAELSPNYLRTVFKNATGKSPTDYLTDYRLERAMDLLATTRITTREIASAVGYYNHRYFYSVFKAKTGMTATEYRRSQQGGTAPQDGQEANDE